MADLDRLQTCALTPIDPQARRARWVAAVIGDSPSRYSKSPALWNAAFAALHIDARYVALDVEESRLGDLLRAIGESPSVLGVNVTVPHKLAVIEYLDELDESAQSTGAVNTITRAPSGALMGSNTDGIGFVETLLSPQFGDSAPLFATLAGAAALVLGAGGSARAVAFALAQRLADRKLLIANSHKETAAARAPVSGSRAADIEANHGLSLSIARSVPRDTVFYDLVYHPEETVFLLHARETGHRAVNGRGMIVAQAVESFMNHICRQQLQAAGLHNEQTRRRLVEIMLAAF